MSHQGTVWSQAQKCIHWPPWREFQEENAGGRWGRTAGPSASSKEQSESQIWRTRDGSWENRGRWTFWAKGTAGVKASERRRAQELRVAWPGAGQVDLVQSSGHWPGNPGTSLQDFHRGWQDLICIWWMITWAQCGEQLLGTQLLRVALPDEQTHKLGDYCALTMRKLVTGTGACVS